MHGTLSQHCKALGWKHCTCFHDMDVVDDVDEHAYQLEISVDPTYVTFIA